MWSRSAASSGTPTRPSPSGPTRRSSGTPGPTRGGTPWTLLSRVPRRWTRRSLRRVGDVPRGRGQVRFAEVRRILRPSDHRSRITHPLGFGLLLRISSGVQPAKQLREHVHTPSVYAAKAVHLGGGYQPGKRSRDLGAETRKALETGPFLFVRCLSVAAARRPGWKRFGNANHPPGRLAAACSPLKRR